MKKYLFCSLLAFVPLSAFSAPNPADFIDEKLKSEIKNFVSNDIVIQSLRFQNEKHKNLTTKGVEELDQLWRKQREDVDQYFVSAVLSNPLSSYLTRVQAHADGKFVEIFVMDFKGLNVGQSAVSSDFWQGDEAKWQKTFLKGSGAVFVDEAEYDEDIDRWRAQYNISITDPATNQAIGAATVELNLTELARLKGEMIDD